MPQRIVPNKVVTVTKDGECHVFITLDLNININTNGQVSTQQSESANEVPPVVKEDDSTKWEIPDFGTFNSNLLNFGKDVTDGKE